MRPHNRREKEVFSITFIFSLSVLQIITKIFFSNCHFIISPKIYTILIFYSCIFVIPLIISYNLVCMNVRDVTCVVLCINSVSSHRPSLSSLLFKFGTLMIPRMMKTLAGMMISTLHLIFVTKNTIKYFHIKIKKNNLKF